MGKSRTKFFLVSRDEGSKVPGDCGSPLDQQPEWFDESKMLEATRVFHDYSAAVLLSHLLGTIIMSQVASLVEVLLATGHHDNLASAVKRSVMTTYHVREWYEGRVQDQEGPARRGVKLVRNMHTKASKIVTEQRPKTDDTVWLSQYDMALTQFAFVGALVVNPKKLGFFGTDSEIESILYYWRYIGYLLGMEDKYNLCAGTYKEVKAACQDIVDEVAKPTLAKPQPKFTRTIEYAFVGFGKIGVAVYYPSLFNFTCDLLDCTELKKSLTLKEFLALCFFSTSTFLMSFPRFRIRANAEHERKSDIKIHRIIEDIKKGELVVSEPKADSNNAIWKIFYHIQSLFVFVFEKLRKSHDA